MYKIENTASDIKLQHPGKIEPRFLADDSTVKIKGIILNKPYKLQITAVGKVNGAKKKRVRSIEYSSTLINALTNAKALRVKWIEENNKFFIIEGETNYNKTKYTIKDFLNSYPQYCDVNIIYFVLVK